MSISQSLATELAEGTVQIGQLLISKFGDGYEIRHYHDSEAAIDELKTHTDRMAGREIGLYTPDGEYRFTKGELSLNSGWRVVVESADALVEAVNAFYPASLGLARAADSGKIRIQHLRDKLGRQTGMYRFAGTISDDGAQGLVDRLCGPSNKCVKKILWKIDDETPLAPGEAADFNGIVSDTKGHHAIPMVCQEACNFFVAECRKAAKKEFEAKQG